MSNQIVISSGAKVRSLEGVLTGTAGIVNSVPLGGANGVATLDSSGKVPLSQLPASVVTYLGTWNAATNTPTLANGTGDVGDLYICNVAGTVNFGAGPITFAVGDWVIYNGSQWQKSAGQNGTVTSVAVTSTGNDAISITGSPITTAGTINIGFTGTSAQYVNGAGDLTTFPSLTGYVPYTGATTDVDLGVHVLNAQALHVKGTAGAGHLGLKHQSAAATGSANESLIYANVDGDLAWQNDNLYLTTLSTHANTANRVYTFPNASGTLALTSDIPSLSGYIQGSGTTNYIPKFTASGTIGNSSMQEIATGLISVTGTTLGELDLIGTSQASLFLGHGSTTDNIIQSSLGTSFNILNTIGTTQTYLMYYDYSTKALSFQTNGFNTRLSISSSGVATFSGSVVISNTGNQPLKLADYATSITTTTGYTTIGTNANGFQIINGGGKGANFFFGSSTYAYYLPSSNGTIALTSDIPSLSGYVPYTGATGSVNLGANNNLTASTLFTSATADGGLWMTQASSITGLEDSTTYTSIKAYTSRYVYFSFGQTSTYKRFRFDVNGLTDATTITYTMPNASGTLALTSDIPSLANYVTLTGTQTITGVKTFSNEQLFSNGLTINGGYLTFADSGFSSTLDTTTLTASRAILLPNASGTLALTSQLTSGTVTSVGLSSATSGVTIGSSPITTSGTITLAIATASGSQQGLLSSTDWTTFNNKQNALTNPVTGTGTTNYHAKFTGSTTLGNSLIQDDGTTITLGGILSGTTATFTTGAKIATASGQLLVGSSTSTIGTALEVVGDIYASNKIYAANGTAANPSFRFFAGASGLYTTNGDNLGITTNGASRLFITSSGNVGIGTSSPTAWNGNQGLIVSQTGTGNTNTIYSIQSAATSTDTGGIFEAYSTNTTSGSKALGSVVFLRENTSTTALSSYTAFYTNNAGTVAERMRITSGGDVLIGQTTASGSVNGIYLRSGQDSGMIATSDSALSLTRLSTNGKILRFFYAGSEVGSISTNTNSLPSDLNFKKDITDMSLGLNLVNKLRPVHYRHKMDNEDEPLSNGIIAQELEEALLECGIEKNTLLMLQHKPTEDKNQSEYWVDYIKIIPILINSIQELSAKVTALENK